MSENPLLFLSLSIDFATAIIWGGVGSGGRPLAFVLSPPLCALGWSTSLSSVLCLLSFVLCRLVSCRRKSKGFSDIKQRLPSHSYPILILDVDALVTVSSAPALPYPCPPRLFMSRVSPMPSPPSRYRRPEGS